MNPGVSSFSSGGSSSDVFILSLASACSTSSYDSSGGRGRVRLLEVGIVVALNLGGALPRIVDRIGAGAALVLGRGKFRGLDEVGRDVTDRGKAETQHPDAGRYREKPQRHHRTAKNPRRALPPRHPDIESGDRRHDQRQRGACKHRNRDRHGDFHRKQQHAVQNQRHDKRDGREDREAARPGGEERRRLVCSVIDARRP